MNPLWTPDPERAARSGMARFMRLAGKRDYAELHRWSVEHGEDFWELVWKFGQVRGEPGLRRLINAGRIRSEWLPERSSIPRKHPARARRLVAISFGARTGPASCRAAALRTGVAPGAGARRGE